MCIRDRGNVSHELKTPIALIQGYAEGLKEGVNEDAQSREFYCDVIMDEASKMNQMVKNLLTLNQLEFGDEDIVFDRFNLTALVRGVLQSMEIMADQAGAKILLHTEEDIYACLLYTSFNDFTEEVPGRSWKRVVQESDFFYREKLSKNTEVQSW